MTDNEIIKALIDCSTYAYHYCSECGFKDGDLLKAALDLINRQKEEIERLERHTEMYHEVRAEAVKEFIEKFKERASSAVAVKDGIVIEGTRTYHISEVKIYEIEKEMAGEG